MRCSVLKQLAAAVALAMVVPASAQVWNLQGALDKTSGAEIRLLKDKEVVDTVRRESLVKVQTVTQRLVYAFDLPMPTILINRGSAPNAAAGPGKDGQPLMFINTEMLRLLNDDEDLMASVIGHELGHLKAEHGVKGHNRSNAIGLIGMLAGLLVDVNQAKQGVDTGGAGMALGQVGAGLVNAKYDRDQEREADDLGVRRMAEAGYDPNAASRMWEMMATRTQGGSGYWMSTHPSHSERFETLRVAATELRPVYLAALQRRGETPSSVLAMVTPAADQDAGWQMVGERGASIRMIQEGSVRQIDGGISYLVGYRYKSPKVRGFNRPAVADCSTQRRFDVVSESAWTERPFAEVEQGSVESKEIEMACAMAARQVPRPAPVDNPPPDEQWLSAVETANGRRLVLPASIREVNGAVVYLVGYRYRNGVTGFNRYAVGECASRRRFDVVSDADWAAMPWSVTNSRTPEQQELNFVCQHLAALREGGGAAPVPAPAPAASGWQAAGGDVYAHRFIDAGSIKDVTGAISYTLRYQPKDSGRQAYTRTVVADCTGLRRFEISLQEEWTSRPFKTVYPGTPAAEEVATACRLAAVR